MMPNILQLGGTILTLITAVLSALGLFEFTRKKLGIIALSSSNSKESVDEEKKVTQEENEVRKIVFDLKKVIRELSYGITGITLIIIGFYLAALGLDYKEHFIFYIIPPVILFVWYFCLFVYNFLKPLIKGKKFLKRRFFYMVIFGLFTMVIFYFMHISPFFAASSAFLGSTVFLINIILIFLESSVNNYIINKVHQKIYDDFQKNLDSMIGEANNIIQNQKDEASKLYNLISEYKSKTNAKDKSEKDNR